MTSTKPTPEPGAALPVPGAVRTGGFPAQRSPRVPVPGAPSGGSAVTTSVHAQDPVATARLLLARAMLRGAPPVDDVTFTAPCPACGRGCEWHQERIDTRMRATVRCDCDG